MTSSVNLQKLENQLQKSMKTGSGFVHTDLTGHKFRVNKKDVEIMKNRYDQKVLKKGGFLPLIPLFAGLSALGALSGGAAGIAKAVNDANHNKEIEKLASEKGVTVVQPQPQAQAQVSGQGIDVGQTSTAVQGGALFLNPYQGKGIKDFIKGVIKNSNVNEIGSKQLLTF